MRKLSHDPLPDTISAISKLALPDRVKLHNIVRMYVAPINCWICRSEQIGVRVYLNMKCAANILISSKVKKRRPAYSDNRL